MAADATNIFVGAGGIIYWGDTALHGGSAAVPTDATTAPGAGWTDIGHVSDDGVTEGYGTSDSKIKNWYGTVVRTITSEQEFTLKFSLMETNAETLKAYYNDPDATATAFKAIVAQGIRRAWVVDAVDGVKTRRLFVPDAQITGKDDITSSTDSVIGYGLTLTCYPVVDTGDQVAYYGYVDDGVA